MQGRDVPVPDGLFPAGVLADLLDREIDLDESLGIGRGMGHEDTGELEFDTDIVIYRL